MMAQMLLRAACAQLARSPATATATTTVSRQLRNVISRQYAASAAEKGGSGGLVFFGGLAAAGAGLYYAKENGYLDEYLKMIPETPAAPVAPPKPVEVVKDYSLVKQAIADLLDADEYDDGSYGPVLVRLAWHASGTYDQASNTGGSNGATMRFAPECEFAANAGLQVARDLLEPVKQKFPWISYADLWTLAGCVAIEEMGGPKINWRPGRVDKLGGEECPPDGRLPDGDKGAAHVRDIFYRMGFSDQEIVALVGAHTLGRCHADRSGYVNPWTNAPTTFSNLYFQDLLNKRWRKKRWSGPLQYEDSTGTLMMLPTDMALIWDRKFKRVVQEYAKDEAKFFQDFAAAFTKLIELGCEFPEDSTYL